MRREGNFLIFWKPDLLTRFDIFIPTKKESTHGGLILSLIHIYGRNLFRTVIFLYADGKSVSGLQCVMHIAVLSIDKDTFRHTFDLSEVL